MSKEKNGIVKIVAKTGGIIFEDEPDKWYNPTASAKNYITPEMKGKSVTIRLADNDEQKFSFIFVDKEQPQQHQETVKKSNSGPDPVMTKDDYWKRKELRDLEQDAMRGRGAALNTAIEMLKSKNEPIKLDQATQLANEIIKWVENKRDQKNG